MAAVTAWRQDASWPPYRGSASASAASCRSSSSEAPLMTSAAGGEEGDDIISVLRRHTERAAPKETSATLVSSGRSRTTCNTNSTMLVDLKQTGRTPEQ